MSNDSRDDQWAPKPGEDASNDAPVDASFDTAEPDDDTIIRPIIGAGAVPVRPDDVPPLPPLPPRPSAPISSAEAAFAPADPVTPGAADSASSGSDAFASGLPNYDVSHVGAPPPLPPAVSAGSTGSDRRGRMPIWGWVAIAAAVFVLVGGGTFTVVSLLQSSGTPQASESPAPSESATPAAPLAEGEYALADAVPFDAPPAWKWDVAEGWESSDDTLGDGWTAYVLPTYGGCMVQFYDATYDVTGDDAADSAALLDDVFATVTEGAMSVTETDTKPYWIQTDGTALVAMERVSYDLIPAGESREFRLAVRARVFSETDTAVAAAYMCPKQVPSEIARNSVNAATLVTGGLD